MASSRRICIGFFLLLTMNACLSIDNEYCPTVSQENLRKLVDAINELAFKIYKNQSLQTSKNIFFSPLVIFLSFGTLIYGARGKTAEELRTVLGYQKADLPTDLVNCIYHRLHTKDLSKRDIVVPGYSLFLDKCIIEDNYELIADYVTEVLNQYPGCNPAYDIEHDSANAAKDINEEVKRMTGKKIDSLLNILDPSTFVVLLHAASFKGTWKTQFDPKETRPQTFYNDGLESGKLVSMMHIETQFPYTTENDLKALELPYKGENLCMIVLLPNQRDGLSNMVNNLTPEKLSTIRKNLYNQTVKVSLPKFQITFPREMNDFKALFSSELGNLSGMTIKKKVFVDQIINKAFAEVNEEGSEATAATAIVIMTASDSISPDLPTEFTADHPFMYVITDKRSDMILFAGSVNNL